MEYICDIIGNRLCPYVYTHAYTSMMLMAQIVCVCVQIESYEKYI